MCLRVRFTHACVRPRSHLPLVHTPVPSIHRVGSFGTTNVAPATSTIPATCPVNWEPNVDKQLGFIADYGRDGWNVGSPGWSGDYFTPGSPLEGFLLQYTNSAGAKFNAENKGLQYESNRNSLINPQLEPTAFEITSDGEGSEGEQSAVWQSTLEDLQVRNTAA